MDEINFNISLLHNIANAWDSLVDFMGWLSLKCVDFLYHKLYVLWLAIDFFIFMPMKENMFQTIKSI